MATDDKTVKSRKWGKHVVPIHPKLIELGFLDHVERMRAKGHDRLWPRLKYDKGGVRGYTTKLTTYFGRRFQEDVTFDAVGEAPTFHSFRKNFASMLEEVGVDDGTATKLMGHRRANVVLGKTYHKNGPAKMAAILKPAIDKLDFPCLHHLKP